MKIHKVTLDNGFTVILAPQPSAQTITGIFAARAGWKYETRDNDGVAHFLEHMTFKGTKKRPTPLDITKEIDSRGGEINAFTSEEMTGYWFKMPHQFTDVVCDLMSDMLLNSKFEQEEIDKESGTIIQELRMYEDTPSSYVGLVLWPKLLYGDQPAGWCAIGTEESIKSLKRRQFVDFLENLYVSENTVVCLAGKIPHIKKTIAEIEKKFKKIKKGPSKISKPAVIENQTEPAVLAPFKEIQQSHILLGVRTFNIHDERQYALTVLQIILGGNMSSRMFTEIRERRGLAYYIRTLNDPQTDVGSLATTAGIDKEKTQEAIKVMMDEYKKIREEKVPEEELQRAKDYINGSSQMSLESSSDVAHHLAEQFILEDKITLPEEDAKKINAVTAEDVLNVAQDIFVDKSLNLAVIGPHKNMEDEFKKLLKF